MSFVVVFASQVREFLVVPDYWVMELNSAKLKNYGANRNQDFLVFWSALNDQPILDAVIDFNAVRSVEYVPTVEKTCYICRVKKFFGN